jgi:hypothetical protein
MSDLMNGPENDTFGFVCPICGGRVHMVRATRSENAGEGREQYMDPALQHKFSGNCQCATWIYWFELGKKETIEAQKRARRGEGPHLYSFKCQTCGHSIGGIIGAGGLLMAANAHLRESSHDRAGVRLMDHTSNSLLDWAEVKQLAATEELD